jgi:hypothetical protein
MRGSRATAQVVRVRGTPRPIAYADRVLRDRATLRRAGSQNTESLVTLRAACLFAALVLCTARPAQGQAQATLHETAPFAVRPAWGEQSAERSSAAGVFLPYTDSATTHTHAVAIESHVAYDPNRRGAQLQTRGEVVLFARRTMGLALMGGGTYVSARAPVPESSGAFGGLKLQALAQAQFGVDLAISCAYLSRGFNLRPAVATELLLGRSLGALQLLLNVGYGQGVRDNERFGALRGALLHHAYRGLHVGLDARFAADLELDAVEPTGEPEFEANGGAVLSYAISHVTVSATGGPAALRFRDGRDTHLGVALAVGIGATL